MESAVHPIFRRVIQARGPRVRENATRGSDAEAPEFRFAFASAFRHRRRFSQWSGVSRRRHAGIAARRGAHARPRIPLHQDLHCGCHCRCRGGRWSRRFPRLATTGRLPAQDAAIAILRVRFFVKPRRRRPDRRREARLAPAHPHEKHDRRRQPTAANHDPCFSIEHIHVLSLFTAHCALFIRAGRSTTLILHSPPPAVKRSEQPERRIWRRSAVFSAGFGVSALHGEWQVICREFPRDSPFHLDALTPSCRSPGKSLV